MQVCGRGKGVVRNKEWREESSKRSKSSSRTSYMGSGLNFCFEKITLAVCGEQAIEGQEQKLGKRATAVVS